MYSKTVTNDYGVATHYTLHESDILNGECQVGEKPIENADVITNLFKQLEKANKRIDELEKIVKELDKE